MGRTGQGPTRDGRWIELPHTGWGALIASQSPAGWVRRVATPPAGLVAETVTSGGHTTVTRRPATPAEAQSILDDIREYLASAGVDPGAWEGHWEAWAAADVTQEDWWAAVNSAQAHGPPRNSVAPLRNVLADLALAELAE